jgi:hypothetical protein
MNEPQVFIISNGSLFVVEWREEDEIITYYIYDGIFFSRLYFNLESGEDQKYQYYDGGYHCSSSFHELKSEIKDTENKLWEHEFIFLYSVLLTKDMTNILVGYQISG